MAVAINKGIFIVAAKRTPFGRFGGAFKDIYPADLLAVAAKDALKAGSVAPEVIDTSEEISFTFDRLAFAHLTISTN